MKDLLNYEEWLLIQTIALEKTEYLRKIPQKVDPGAVKAFTYLHTLIGGAEEQTYRRMVELHAQMREAHPERLELFSGLYGYYFTYSEMIWARMCVIAHFFYHADPFWQERVLPDMQNMLPSGVMRKAVTDACQRIDNYFSKMAEYAPVPAPEPAPEPVAQPEPSPEPEKPILRVSAAGKYTDARKYIEERKRFDEEFKEYCNNRTLRELCERLTKEFGWFVDENSLGKNINRHTKGQ